jgi:hypothetical protein
MSDDAKKSWVCFLLAFAAFCLLLDPYSVIPLKIPQLAGANRAVEARVVVASRSCQ